MWLKLIIVVISYSPKPHQFQQQQFVHHVDKVNYSTNIIFTKNNINPNRHNLCIMWLKLIIVMISYHITTKTTSIPTEIINIVCGPSFHMITLQLSG